MVNMILSYLRNLRFRQLFLLTLGIGGPIAAFRQETLRKKAEEAGSLLPVGSVYSPEDKNIRDDLRLPGGDHRRR